MEKLNSIEQSFGHLTVISKITKENFCILIDNIEKYYRFLETLEKVSQIDFTNSPFYSFPNQVSHFLVELFFYSRDPYCINDIDYYMWELDFGKKWKPGTITVDGNDIPLRNSKDLWNILTLGENDEA